MIQVNRIYLIFNRLVTKKFLVDTSDLIMQNVNCGTIQLWLGLPAGCRIVRHGGMTFIRKDIGDVLINN